ncbi:unnamed protein product [Parajaminaea phylloscopi]
MTSPIIIYIDGACVNNGQPTARGGIGIFCEDSRFHIRASERMNPPCSSNRAELTAALRALQLCDDFAPVTLVTDSLNVVMTFSEWVWDWIGRGWRTPWGDRVRNQDIIQHILDDMESRRWHVTFKHVKGHSGIFGNEVADRLARDACRL